MATWYYVDGQERVGPVDEEEIRDLLKQGHLNSDSYIWTKGFDNWKKVVEVDRFQERPDLEELESNFQLEENAKTDEAALELNEPDWDSMDLDNQIFVIKVGRDRNEDEVEYGPFSLREIQRAFQEKRISGKTYIFCPGMEDWKFLADIPIYKELFSELPPVIDEDDRREHTRKPFVARMLFHNNSDVFEGVCRDISVGGLQVLVSGFPGKRGDTVTLNVHPDNSNYSFVAKGKIVRILEGNAGFSLRFTDLSGETQKAIKSYLEE